MNLEYSQFSSLLTMLHGPLKTSPTIAKQLHVFRKKLDTFKTQNRKQYFQFLNRLLQQDNTMFANGFEELKLSIEIQDPAGLSLYSFLKKEFLKNGLDEQITFDPTRYYFPKPALDNLAKCLSYDLTKQNYETLDQVISFLTGNRDVEQYAALHLLEKCARGLNGQLRDQVLHRAFVLTHAEYHMMVRLKAIEFIYELAQLPNVSFENCLTSTEIQELFQNHLPLMESSFYVIKSLLQLGNLFYDHVPGFIRRFLQATTKHHGKFNQGFMNFAEVIFHLIDLEHKQQSAIEEFEEYDIPHCISYHNELTSNFDVASENLSKVFQAQKLLSSGKGLLKAPHIDKIADLGGLLDLPLDVTTLPPEMQLHLFAGLKRDYTNNYENIIKAMEYNMTSSASDYFLSKQLFDQFQVPPTIIENNIKETIRSSWPEVSRAIMFCPTSVVLNTKVKNDANDLMIKRMLEPLAIEQSYSLRPAVEFIELIRILGINSHANFDAVLQHFLPVLNVQTTGTIVDTILHQHLHTLLLLCHGSISDTTAKQLLQICLASDFGSSPMSSMLASELSIIVNSVASLTQEEAKKMLSNINTGLLANSNWNIEESFELMRLIGQRSQFTTTEFKALLNHIRKKTVYNVFNVFSGFESVVGSQDYLDIVISFIQQLICPNDDVQLEFILKGLNNLFDVHKKKSCVEMFAAKMDVLLNLIDPAFSEPSHETLLAFLYFIRNILRTCPDLVVPAIQHHSTVLRVIEQALSPNVVNPTMRDYANQISSMLKSQAK